jgi:predicted small lipoprotein YifL
MKLRPLVILFAAALALGACGKRGTLERPAPLFGHGDKATEQTDDSGEEAKDDGAQRKGSDGSVRARAPEQRNTSIRVAPIEGAPRDPRAGPGQPTDPGY